MKPDFNLIISIVAIAISIFTILMTKRNVKKQLRLSKLEEILEIINFMGGYYRSLFILFNDVNECLESLKKSNEVTDKIQKTTIRQKGFTDNITKDDIINKSSRLVTLSNAYLPNSDNLKLKIYTLTTVYYNMYKFVALNNPIVEIEELSIIPKPGEMERFIKKIESQIIKEMNLGYKPVSKKDQKKYFENQFKSDIENA